MVLFVTDSPGVSSPKVSNFTPSDERASTKVSNTPPKKTVFTVTRNSIPIEEVPDCSCDEGNSKVRGTPQPNRPVNIHHHCRHCNSYVTYSRAGVIRHEVMVHSIRHPRVNIYECPVCSKLFIHVSEYQRHIKMHSARSRDPKVRQIIRNEDSKCEALIVKVVKPSDDPDFKIETKQELKKDIVAVKQEFMSAQQSGARMPQQSTGLMINETLNPFVNSPPVLNERQMPTLIPEFMKGGTAPTMKHDKMPTLTPTSTVPNHIIRFCRDNTLMCDINGCQWKMVLVADIKEHVWLSHGMRLNKLKGYCDRCVKSYSQYGYFLSHLKQNHGLAENIKLEKLEEFGQEENRVNQLSSLSAGIVQPDQLLEKTSSTIADPNAIKTVQFHPDQKLHCHIEECKFTVTILSEMRVHLKSDHKVKIKFQKGLCQLCQYAPNKYKNFEKHLRKKHDVHPGDLDLDKEISAGQTAENENQVQKEADQNGGETTTALIEVSQTMNSNTQLSDASNTAQHNESLPDLQLDTPLNQGRNFHFQESGELLCQFKNGRFKATNLTDVGRHVELEHGKKLELFKGSCIPCSFSVNEFGKFEEHLVEKHSQERRVKHVYMQQQIMQKDNHDGTTPATQTNLPYQHLADTEVPTELLPCVQFRKDGRVHCHADGCIFSSNVLSDLKVHIADFHGENIAALKAYCCTCIMPFTRYASFPSHLLRKHSVQLGHGDDQMESLGDASYPGQPPVQINLPMNASNIGISLQEDNKIHCHIDYCNFRCFALNDIKAHLAKGHGRAVKTIETYCGVCSAHHTTINTFSRHVIWKHSVEIYADAPSFPQVQNLVAQCESDAQQPVTIKLPQDGSPIHLSLQEDAKLHCHFDGCSFTSTLLNTVRIHFAKVHNNPMSVIASFCGICMFRYHKYGSFSQHVVWKHDLQYVEGNYQVPTGSNQSYTPTQAMPSDGAVSIGGTAVLFNNTIVESPAGNSIESRIIRFKEDNRIHCYNENCAFGATSTSDILHHVRQMHGIVSKYLQGYCEICGSYSNRYSNFVQHLRQRHLVDSVASDSYGAYSTPQAHTGSRFIPDEFTDVSMMLRYKKNNRICCYNETCGFSATNTSDMTTHLHSVHGVSLSRLQGFCEMCSSYSNRASNFFTHLRQKHSVQTGDRRTGVTRFEPMDPDENQLDQATTQNVYVPGENSSTLGVFHPEMISTDELEYEFFPDSDDEEIFEMFDEIQKPIGSIRNESDGLHCFDFSCQFVGATLPEIKMHIREIHGRITRELSGICELCGISFKKYKKFKKHVTEEHYMKVQQRVADKENTEPGEPAVIESHTTDSRSTVPEKSVLQSILNEPDTSVVKRHTDQTNLQVSENDVELQRPEAEVIQSHRDVPKAQAHETSVIQSPIDVPKVQEPEQKEIGSEPSGRISCRKDKMLHCEFGDCIFETKFLIEAREHVSAIHGETEMQGYCEVCDIPHVKYTRFKQHVISKHTIEMGVPGAYNFSNNEQGSSRNANKKQSDGKNKSGTLRTPSPVKSHLLVSSPVKSSTTAFLSDFDTPETQHLPGHEQPVPEIKPSLFIHYNEDHNLHCQFEGCNFLSSRHSDIRVHMQYAHGTYLKSIHGVCKICKSEHTYKNFIHHLKNKHLVETGWTGRENAVFNISVHNKTKVFCGGCSKKLRFRKGRRDLLKEHIAQVHKVSIAQLMFYCPACGTSTLNYYTFKLHLLQWKHRAKYSNQDKIKNKDPEDEPSGEFLKSLEICKLPSTTKELSEMDSQDAAQDRIVISCHQDGIIDCKKCTKIFHGMKYVYEHTLQWHPSDEFIYHCKLCDMKFLNGRDFHCHLSSTLHKITVLEEEISGDDEVSEDEMQGSVNSVNAQNRVTDNPEKYNESSTRRDSVPAQIDTSRRPSITELPGKGSLPMVKQEIYIPKKLAQRDVGKDYQPKEPLQTKKKALFKVQYGTDDRLHCGHCPFSDTIEVNMKKHLIQEHKEKLSFAFCICEPCSQCYNSYFPFKYHVQQSHGIRESEDMTSPTPSIKIDVTETGLIRCTKCDFTSTEPQHVRNHATYAHKIKQVFLQFECLPCKMITRQYNNFASHLNFSKHKKTIERNGKKHGDDDDATSAYGDDVANLNDVMDECTEPQEKRIKTEPNTDNEMNAEQVTSIEPGNRIESINDINAQINTLVTSGERTWMDALPRDHRTSLDEERYSEPIGKEGVPVIQNNKVNTNSKGVLPKAHSKSITIVCKECPIAVEFSSIDDLMNHKKNVHPARAATFRCKSCNLDAPTYEAFMEHIKTVHRGGRIKMAKPGSASTRDSTVKITASSTVPGTREPIIKPSVDSAPVDGKTGSISEAANGNIEREDFVGKLIKELADTEGKSPVEQTTELHKSKIAPSKTPESASTSSDENERNHRKLTIIPQFNDTLKSALENVKSQKANSEPLVEGNMAEPENAENTNTPRAETKQGNESKQINAQQAITAKIKLDSEDKENSKKVNGLEKDKPMAENRREAVLIKSLDLDNSTICRCCCNICKLKFKYMRKFEVHLATRHAGIQPIITCRPCQKRFRTKRSTIKHVNSDEHKRKVKRTSSPEKVDISQ